MADLLRWSGEFPDGRHRVWANQDLRFWKEAPSVVIDPKGTYEMATRQARRVRKSGGRLLVAGIGFGAAYFLDPDHGTSRRHQAVSLIGRWRRTKASPSYAGAVANISKSDPVVPDARTASQQVSNGVRPTIRR